jgi:hypothetical protein
MPYISLVDKDICADGVPQQQVGCDLCLWSVVSLVRLQCLGMRCFYGMHCASL